MALEGQEVKGFCCPIVHTLLSGGSSREEAQSLHLLLWSAFHSPELALNLLSQKPNLYLL